MMDVTLDPNCKTDCAEAAVVDRVEEAAGSLIRRHWGAVRRYLRVLGVDSAGADDLAQDVFVVALRKGLEDRGGQTLAWLRRTARNLFLEHSRKRRPVLLEAAEAVWHEHRDDDAERQRALRTCLPLLTERSQQAVRLAYGERQSWAQIATVLGMQASGVKTLLRRCRATLKECIERTMSTTKERSR